MFAGSDSVMGEYPLSAKLQAAIPLARSFEVRMKPIEEIVVADPSSLVECCARLATYPQLGFDTEFVGEDTYEPSLCLIQVASPDALYLIDPLSSGPLDAFWRILVDPSRVVIVHAGREETRLCRRLSGEMPTNWFDLQVAAGLVGMNYPLGHSALVSQLLGVQLSKGETLTEWRHRPLSPAQMSYAFNDVRYLLPLYQRLNSWLTERDRLSWVREEFERFRYAAVRDVSNPQVAEDKWRRIKGVGALDRKRLAMVREMHAAREAIATQMNRPPRVLVRDDLLVEIARRNPKSAEDVEQMRGLAKKFVQPMWDAIQRARATPSTQWPDIIEREQDPAQVALVVSVMSAVLNDLCGREGLASSLTCTISDLRDLVRTMMRNEPPSPTNLLMTGWRREFVLPRLLDVLEGRRGLRIANLQAESPFVLE